MLDKNLRLADLRRWRLIEPNGGGHRLWYISLLLQRLSTMTARPMVQIVTQPDAPMSATWQEHVSPWEDVIDSVIALPAQSRLAMLRDAARQRILIVIPDGDRWLPALAMARFTARRSLAGSILLMRPKPESTGGSRRRHLLKTALITCVRLAHPHLRILNLVAVSSASRDEVLDPVEFAPSGQNRGEWLRLNGLDPTVKWLVVLGEISERKCIRMLCEAVCSPEARDAGWHLLMIGNATDQALIADVNILSAAFPGRIVQRNTFLANVEFDTWVANADAVSVIYRNEGSSGVLLKCWAAGTPVLAGGSNAVRDASTALGMNHVLIEELSARSVLDALQKIAPPTGQEACAHWQARSGDFADSLLCLDTKVTTKVGN